MIHKIEQITSIGKFRNYTASGDVAFRKLTLFYADNGTGKTTLTSIIRSLTSGDVTLIAKRISLGATTPQVARLVQRAATTITHTYRPTGWSNPFPDIEIFDTHFVSENVFSGFDFTDEHKKELYKFVIGAQGVAIQQQIESNKQDKANSRQAIENLETQIIQQVGNGITTEVLNAYLAITTPHANIDQAITEAETKLTNANANSIIQAIQLLSTIAPVHTGINFNTIITDLQQTSQTIQDVVLQKIFSEHCIDLENNSITAPENWLKEGFNYINSKSNHLPEQNIPCPFCQQPISATIDIITAYTQQFNDEFNGLVQRLQQHFESVSRFNLDAAIQSISNTISQNADLIALWSSHLPANTVSPSTIVIPDEASIRGQMDALIAAIRQKQQIPSAAIDTSVVSAFMASGQGINANIAAYNSEVTQYNATITQFRTGIQGVPQAQAEVDRLKRLKKRFDPPIVALCTQLQNEKQRLRQLEGAYPALIQQQENAARGFFASYKDRINYYLGHIFRTPFRIDNVVHVSPQGRATQSKVAYTLTINGHPISFDATQNHNAKDCLSDGDKSTLALAFFLAKLDIDPNKANKIVVFDDPLSSFDRNRRLYTVQVLKGLLGDVKQVVVLSHNEHFLFELTKGVSAGEKQTLRITENFALGASSIEPLSLDELVENEYFKHINTLQSFLANPDITKKDYVLGLMRNVLEAHIRFKFYRQTMGLSPNQRTLGTLITTLDTSGVAFRNGNRAQVLQSLHLINGISCKPHHGEPIPDYATLGVDPNTITVAELATFVQDTLDLVDNHL